MLVTAVWRCTWGRGREGAMAPAPLSARFQPLPPLPTIKLCPSGAGSRVGGLVHALSPCGSLQGPLLWGWEFLLLPPQHPRAFSIRGLRLYFPLRWSPGLCSLLCSPPFVPVYLWVNVGPQGATHCSACPVLCHSESSPLGLSVRECGDTGSASGQTACPVGHTLRQSQSRCSNTSPLCPVPISALPTGLDVCFFFIYLVSDFLAIRFSVSSGCARRRSVSTYAAILVLLNFYFLILFTFFIHPLNFPPICWPSICSLYLFVSVLIKHCLKKL